MIENITYSQKEELDNIFNFLSSIVMKQEDTALLYETVETEKKGNVYIKAKLKDDSVFLYDYTTEDIEEILLDIPESYTNFNIFADAVCKYLLNKDLIRDFSDSRVLQTFDTSKNIFYKDFAKYFVKEDIVSQINDYFFNYFIDIPGIKHDEKGTIYYQEEFLPLVLEEIISFKRTKIINEFENRLIDFDTGEQNYYYRMLNGLPDKEYIFNKDGIEGVSSNDKITVDTVADLSLKDKKTLIKNNPSIEYLKYIIHPIPINEARLAKDFHLLYYDSSYLGDEKTEKFVELYYENLNKMMMTIYTNSFKDQEMYKPFLRVYLLFITLQNYLSSMLEEFNNIDFFDQNKVTNMFKSYDLNYFSDLPLYYQKIILKNINLLITDAGSNNIYEDVLNVFGLDNTTIYKYYIVKHYKDPSNLDNFIKLEKEFEDNYQKEIFVKVDNIYVIYDKDNENHKGLTKYRRKFPSEIYDLSFSQVPVNESNPLPYITDETTYKTYEDITRDDPYWNRSKEYLLDYTRNGENVFEKFNYRATKYVSIMSSVDILKQTKDASYIFHLLQSLEATVINNSPKGDYGGSKLSFYTEYKTTGRVNVLDGLIAICWLVLMRGKIDSEVSLTDNYANYFDLKLEELREDSNFPSNIFAGYRYIVLDNTIGRDKSDKKKKRKVLESNELLYRFVNQYITDLIKDDDTIINTSNILLETPSDNTGDGYYGNYVLKKEDIIDNYDENNEENIYQLNIMNLLLCIRQSYRNYVNDKDREIYDDNEPISSFLSGLKNNEKIYDIARKYCIDYYRNSENRKCIDVLLDRYINYVSPLYYDSIPSLINKMEESYNEPQCFLYMYEKFNNFKNIMERIISNETNPINYIYLKELYNACVYSKYQEECFSILKDKDYRKEKVNDKQEARLSVLSEYSEYLYLKDEQFYTNLSEEVNNLLYSNQDKENEEFRLGYIEGINSIIKKLIEGIQSYINSKEFDNLFSLDEFQTISTVRFYIKQVLDVFKSYTVSINDVILSYKIDDSFDQGMNLMDYYRICHDYYITDQNYKNCKIDDLSKFITPDDKIIIKTIRPKDDIIGVTTDKYEIIFNYKEEFAATFVIIDDFLYIYPIKDSIKYYSISPISYSERLYCSNFKYRLYAGNTPLTDEILDIGQSTITAMGGFEGDNINIRFYYNGNIEYTAKLKNDGKFTDIQPYDETIEKFLNIIDGYNIEPVIECVTEKFVISFKNGNKSYITTPYCIKNINKDKKINISFYTNYDGDNIYKDEEGNELYGRLIPVTENLNQGFIKIKGEDLNEYFSKYR